MASNDFIDLLRKIRVAAEVTAQRLQPFIEGTQRIALAAQVYGRKLDELLERISPFILA